jgi:hypothetical protein
MFTLWWGFNLDAVGPTWLFGVSFGIATGAFFGYALAALPKYFGTRHVGEIRGTFGAVTMAAAAFGPIAFELLHLDHQGLLLGAASVLAALLAVASVLMRWPEQMGETGATTPETRPTPSGRRN